MLPSPFVYMTNVYTNKERQEMIEHSQKSNDEILTDLLTGQHISNINHIILKEALKPIFFTPKGFMAWARSRKEKDLKNAIAGHKEVLISDKSLSPDDLVERFATGANEYNQGWQLELFYNLHKLILDFEGNDLAPDSKNLLSIIQKSLHSNNNEEKSRAITLVSLFCEMSNSQSRKSTAGNAAEGAVELVLRSIGLVAGETFGSQFEHGEGSDTDFVVPFNKNDEVDDIKAYIAVQSSTNDRLRLSSSELKDSGKRYICSLNGCGASSKKTKDIGDSLIGGQIYYDTYYVIIESEKVAAIKAARKKIENAQKKGNVKDENKAKVRLRWLENHAINYNQFADHMTEIMTRKFLDEVQNQ